MRTTDNRDMSERERYLEARVETLLEALRRTTAELEQVTKELEEAQSIINSIAAEIGV